MNGKLVFWAQALDNASPDHIAFQGEDVSPNDEVRRQQAVSLVSSVVKGGTPVFVEDGFQLTEDGHRFVVEVPSGERDREGRIAPIVCCGEYDATVNEALSAHVAAGIGNFANSIGRTTHAKHLEMTLKAFAALKKKSSTRRLRRTIGIAGLIFGLLAALYALFAGVS